MKHITKFNERKDFDFEDKKEKLKNSDKDKRYILIWNWVHENKISFKEFKQLVEPNIYHFSQEKNI